MASTLRSRHLLVSRLTRPASTRLPAMESAAVLDVPFLRLGPRAPGEGSGIDLSSRRWHMEVARLIDRIDQPDLPAQLFSALQKVVSFDYTVVFAYRGNDRPVDLFDSFDPARRDVFVAAYQEGPYLLDPFYRACAEGIAPGLHRLRDLAPDQFQESEYFRSYYVRTGLTEEIGFFAPLKTEMMVVISLMRDGRSPGFSDEEMAKLRVVEPIVCAIASQHWRSPGAHRARPGRSAPQRIDGLLDTVLAAFGCGNLTAREREIVRLLLLGHSIESTANRLSISTGTVKVHRRNIYSKLSIASHSELFSLFIVALSKL